VGNGGTAIFNPVTDTTNFPTGWFGSCRVTSTGAGVGFVQIRDTITGTAPNAAAYEMIRTTGTDRTVFVPLYMRALQTNQGTLGTAVTIQNLSATTANVTWNYIPSSGAPVSCTQPIPGNSSLIHNQVTGANVCTGVATNAYGSIRITSDQPIDGFVQIRNTTQPNGDTFMAHNVFTTP
jgi:hypothetical protein